MDLGCFENRPTGNEMNSFCMVILPFSLIQALWHCFGRDSVLGGVKRFPPS
jgi:hypothetical protein